MNLLQLYESIYSTSTSVQMVSLPSVRIYSQWYFSLHHVVKMTFPAVTLCNHNRIHCGNLASTIDELQSSSIPADIESLKTLTQPKSC